MHFLSPSENCHQFTTVSSIDFDKIDESALISKKRLSLEVFDRPDSLSLSLSTIIIVPTCSYFHFGDGEGAWICEVITSSFNFMQNSRDKIWKREEGETKMASKRECIEFEKEKCENLKDRDYLLLGGWWMI